MRYILFALAPTKIFNLMAVTRCAPKHYSHNRMFFRAFRGQIVV